MNKAEIKKFIDDGLNAGKWEDDVASEIEDMNLESEVYYYAMEYLDEPINQQIKADQDHQLEKRGLK